MKKLVVGLVCAVGLTASTAVFAAESGKSAQYPAAVVKSDKVGWVESEIDGRGGGTFAQTPFNVQFGGIRSSDVNNKVPAGFHFSVESLEDHSIYLRKAVEIHVEIVNVKTKKVVWTGKMPALAPSKFASWKKFMNLDNAWNQRDSKGRRLAAGTYRAQVKGPVTIQYSLEEKSKILTQKLYLPSINRGGYEFQVGSK
jgi:hypothetical protein